MFAVSGTTTIDGVERLTLGTRLLGVSPITVHCYRVGSTLIDAGPPKRVDALADLVDLEAIEDVVLTHHHEDHVGAAPRLAELGATVHAPEASLEALRDPPGIRYYQRRAWGRPDPVEAEALGKVVETPDLRLEVHATPGHSRDHVVLLAPEEGWLFAGDAWVPPRPILRADEDLAGILDSLETMRDLGGERLFPGHGSARDDAGAAIDELLDHLRELAREAHELAEEGRGPAAVKRELLGREGFIWAYSGGHFSKGNLVEELLGLDEAALGGDPAGPRDGPKD